MMKVMGFEKENLAPDTFTGPFFIAFFTSLFGFQKFIMVMIVIKKNTEQRINIIVGFIFL